MVSILYLVHDLTDAAVRRRVSMMRAGGAAVTVAGFRRSIQPVTTVGDMPCIDLGPTADGALARRVISVARAATRLRSLLRGIRPDVVVARNLEMLVLAGRLRTAGGPAPRLVYESLDIHRMLLRKDPAGALLRGLERRLLRRVSLILTSSPAFTREYFTGVQHLSNPVLLVENKVVDFGSAVPEAPERKAPHRPRRIGWFGALRCRKSLALLADFSRRAEGRYEIVLRGRPAYRELPDFDRFVAGEPFMRFEGAYRSPEDLAAIYGATDMTWAIDFFEEGLNSSWLLPNRLYEGCSHGSLPIAIRGTETARYLQHNDIGLLLPEATPQALAQLLERVSDAELVRLRGCVTACDRALFVSTQADCERLVGRLAGSLRHTTLPAALELMESA